MRLHRAFGLVMLLLLASELSFVSLDPAQASKQIALKSSVAYRYNYQPPRTGVPGRREGGGTR